MWEKSKFDIEEEENNVRKNLSRLIHTLQHFPSKRSGLDTTSLWNIVAELESFNPDRKTKSMQFTQTTERKTYCKKSVNLRICDGKGKSAYVPGSYKTNQKFTDAESARKYGDDSSRNNSNQFKKRVFQKSDVKNTNFSCTPSKGKDKTSLNNIGIKKKSKIISNMEVIANNLEKSNASKYNYCTRRNLQKSENNRLRNKSTIDSLKDPINNMNKNINMSDSRCKTYHNSKKINSGQKYPTKNKIEITGCNMVLNRENRNQIANFKSRSHQCTPKTNKVLQQIISENNQQSVDQKSVVKKLTNYWNNLLNNEFEQCTTTTESSSESSRNVQSLDHLTEGNSNKSDTLSENSNSTLKSRHLSESNINIMKRVEDLDSKKCIHTVRKSRNKLSSTTEKKRTGSVPSNLSVKITNKNSFQALENKRQKDLKENLHQYFKQIDKHIILSTEEVIEYLQKTISALKSFQTCDILSDKVLLPQPLAKKCLYIMAGISKLRPQNNTFFNKLEDHTDQMIQEIIQNSQEMKSNNKIRTNIHKLTNNIPAVHTLPSLNNKLELEMKYMFTNKKEYTEDISTQVQKRISSIKCCQGDESPNTSDDVATDNCESTCDPGNALMIPRINMNKVQNAMKLFMAWKENICSQSFYNYDNTAFSSNEVPPFHSFTFMYRQDIFFDEEFSDEEFSYEDDDSEEDLEDERETMMDMYRLTVVKIFQYINTVINVLENYWLDSPEMFVRMIYQALVSILIWWVLVKEMILN